MKIYCIEIERGGIGEEDLTLHHGFEKEPTKQEVLDYIMSKDIGFDEEYCEFNFYHVADEAKGKTALMENVGLAELAFDADLETRQPIEVPKENYVNRISIDKGGEATGEEYNPKLSPLKTVPIGAGSAIKLTNDKDEMTFLVKQIQDIFYPNFESKEAIQHCNFVRNMLSKLSEQTLKVAEKL